MKPLTEDTWINASGPPGCFLCTSKGGFYSSKEFAKAAGFESADAAEEARASFMAKQRHAMHGPTSWRVYRAQTRTVFRTAKPR